jgi:hypothetical protein
MWSNASKGVFVLNDPANNQGNSDTWIVSDEGNGFWRTADAGKTWNKVSDARAPHGGSQFYYAKDGTLYTGAQQMPQVSKDNGLTWKPVPGVAGGSYFPIVFGTGSMLFTMGFNNGEGNYFQTSDEADGTRWISNTEHGKTAGTTFDLDYDQVNQILYAPSLGGGIWVLRMTE